MKPNTKMLSKTKDTWRLEFIGRHDGREGRVQMIRTVTNMVMEFTGEPPMHLDALLREIAKNIWDHANGLGFLILTRRSKNQIEFEIEDYGTEAFDLEACRGNSQLAGNGQNFGAGLGAKGETGIIFGVAETLGIDLKVSTSSGFRYSGVYTLQAASD